MAESTSRFGELFDKYYNGTATRDETEEFLLLVQDPLREKELQSLMAKAWGQLSTPENILSVNSGQDIISFILSQRNAESSPVPEPQTRSLAWVKYAAAAVVMLLAGYWYAQRDQVERSPKSDAALAANAITPGGEKATLRLDDGSTIALDHAQNGLLASEGSVHVNKTDAGKLEYKTVTSASTEIHFNTVETPRGGKFEVTLPDGSKVWLNSSSSIRFPTGFSQHLREVRITGEVFFEVRKDPKRPFHVQFSDETVEVLGTSFNVRAYPDEPRPKTTLVEGSVKLTHGQNQLELRPGQQGAVRQGGRLTAENVDIEETIAWKNGMFYFKNASIESIMLEASRWYDIEVTYQGAIPHRQFTGKVSRSVKIDELLGMLQYTGVHYRINGRKITIHP